jgi:hypothetical protein
MSLSTVRFHYHIRATGAFLGFDILLFSSTRALLVCATLSLGSPALPSCSTSAICVLLLCATFAAGSAGSDPKAALFRF